MRTLIPAAAAAGLIALAAPLAAQAAVTPQANLVLATSRVTAGSHPKLTYLTSGLPAGAVTRLEIRRAGPGYRWLTAERLGRAGTITTPALGAGVYLYRVEITAAGRLLATSRPVSLTVRPAAGASASSGSSDTWSWLGQAALLVLGYLLGA